MAIQSYGVYKAFKLEVRINILIDLLQDENQEHRYIIQFITSHYLSPSTTTHSSQANSTHSTRHPQHHSPAPPLLQTSIANHLRISAHQINPPFQLQNSYFIILIQGSQSRTCQSEGPCLHSITPVFINSLKTAIKKKCAHLSWREGIFSTWTRFVGVTRRTKRKREERGGKERIVREQRLELVFLAVRREVLRRE